MKRGSRRRPNGTCKKRMKPEEFREAMDERMATPAGRQLYQQRNWIAETPFAIIKALMNLRQFPTRGIDKVKTEGKTFYFSKNGRKIAPTCKIVCRHHLVK